MVCLCNGRYGELWIIPTTEYCPKASAQKAGAYFVPRKDETALETNQQTVVFAPAGRRFGLGSSLAGNGGNKRWQ